MQFSISDKKTAVCLFVILTLTFILFTPGVVGGDPFFYYVAAENIVKHFSVSIHPDIMSKYDLGPSNFGLNPKTGQYYRAYGILSSIVMIPFYYAGEFVSRHAPLFNSVVITQFFAGMTNCFVCAFTGVFLYFILRRFSFGKKASFILVMIYGFATMNFNYAVNGFSEALTGLCFLGAFYYVYGYKNSGRREDLIFSSVYLGLSVLVKFSNCLMIIPFLVYLVFISGKNIKLAAKTVIIYSAVFGVFFIVLCFVNYIKTGIFLSSGYGGEEARFPFGKNIFLNMAGFLISPGRSIFIFNLPVVISLFYLKRFYENFKSETILIALMFAFNLAFYSCLSFWYGGISWGPRYLMPLVPFLILPCAYAPLELKSKKIVKILFITFVTAGFIIQLNSVLFSWHKPESKINIERYFYSLKYSQIPLSFQTTYAYFYKKITQKDYIINIDDKEMNLSALSKVCPWSLKALAGSFTRDSGEVIVLGKKLLAGVYLFFIAVIILYVFIFKKLKKEFEI